MDLVEIFPACARRWYVVIPLLLLTAWFAMDQYASVKPVYYTQAVIGVAPPNYQITYQQPGEQVARNGLIDSGGATLMANLVSIGLRDADVVNRVVAAGGAPDYTAKMYPGSLNSPQLPLVMIEATQPDAQASLQTVEIVLEQAEPVFRKVQEIAGVPVEQRAKALITAPPNPPVAASPSRLRASSAVFAAGLALSLMAGVVADLLIKRFTSGRMTRLASTSPASQRVVQPETAVERTPN